MEMEKKTISAYFSYIQNKITIGGYFLNINRYVKSVVGDDIYFKDYPYDSFWDVIISEKSFLQDHVHFFLTKRTKDKKEIIKNTMNNLPETKKKKKNFMILKRTKKNLLITFYKIITKILLLTFGKKKIRKISKIFQNISNK